jgi:uncharacterized membrane protein
VARPAALAARFRHAVIFITVALAGFVAWWCLAGRLTWAGVVLALLATFPLWIALPRLLKGNRRTYAWMTLAVVPYLVLAMTEAVANPSRRPWAAVTLFLGLTLFMLLIGYLRVSRAR